MACGIHIFYEKLVDGQWVSVHLPMVDGETPLSYRHYYMYGHLAGVRNIDAPSIDTPRGIPDNSPNKQTLHDGDMFYHSHSCINLIEFDNFNYNQMVHNDDNHDGVMVQMKHNMGEGFFSDIERMKANDIERIVFAFDS